MHFVELQIFELEEWWWAYGSIDSSIFTKMDWGFLVLKQQNGNGIIHDVMNWLA